jgi:hypothetical protein
MSTYRVPVVLENDVNLEVLSGRGVGEYTGGLPSDAKREFCLNTPFICGSCMPECAVELAGEAQLAE